MKNETEYLLLIKVLFVNKRYKNSQKLIHDLKHNMNRR